MCGNVTEDIVTRPQLRYFGACQSGIQIPITVHGIGALPRVHYCEAKKHGVREFQVTVFTVFVRYKKLVQSCKNTVNFERFGHPFKCPEFC